MLQLFDLIRNVKKKRFLWMEYFKFRSTPPILILTLVTKPISFPLTIWNKVINSSESLFTDEGLKVSSFFQAFSRAFFPTFFSVFEREFAFQIVDIAEMNPLEFLSFLLKELSNQMSPKLPKYNYDWKMNSVLKTEKTKE